MIIGYRFVSGGKVSCRFRTAAKAKKEAGLSGWNYPLTVVRDTSGSVCDLFVRYSPAAEWVNLRAGLNRGSVTAGTVDYRKSSGTAYDGYRFGVPYSIWGDDLYYSHFTARPTRRMLRRTVKGLKAWYLEFNGEPFAEGE